MKSTTESFQRTEALFNDALAAPAEARAALIAAQSGGDAELAAEVNALLEACQAEERSLRREFRDDDEASGRDTRRAKF